MAQTEIAYLGGGCFWCLEAVFDRLKGVVSVESGYMGGARKSPSYEQVCSGATGHVEIVKVTFDTSKLSYAELLGIFFAVHDPTTMNRQGNDVGTQYRSVIFAVDSEQEETARRVIRELESQRAFDKPIVTAIEPAKEFWEAEPYHQEYFVRNTYQPYCQFVVAPKVEKFRKLFAERDKQAS